MPYSASTGALLSGYLAHRATISRARGRCSCPSRAATTAVSANVTRFSTHTMRHLCLTDPARMGWELHAIATFAGHRSTDSTLRYIHLSGRDLADKLSRGMGQIHAWRVDLLTGLGTGPSADGAI